MAIKRNPDPRQDMPAMTQNAPSQPLQAAPVQTPMQLPAQTQAMIPAPVADVAPVNRIGEEQVTKALQILRKYKGAKARLESQIISAQQWW